MKQITIKVEAMATVMVEDDFDMDIQSIPMKLDVFSIDDDEESPVIEVNETDITEREVVTTAQI